MVTKLLGLGHIWRNIVVDWDAFLANLFSLPPEVHDLFPPCPIERIHEEERVLGKLPDDLRAMLRRFNGGALFIKSIELLTVFGFWMPYKKSWLRIPGRSGLVHRTIHSTLAFRRWATD